MLGYIHDLPEGILKAQQALNDEFCRAMSAKDLDAAMACFWTSPDLVVVLWGNVLRGAEAVRAALAQFFEQHSAVRLDVNDCTHLPAGDGVIAVGTATYRLRDRAGAEQQIVERWTDVRRHIDGRWVYVLDHATVVPE
jgi:uncharacterized protein (TIGR02246 family)